MNSIYPKSTIQGRLPRFLPALLIIILITLACQMSLGGPTAPTERPAVTPDGNPLPDLSAAQPGQEISNTITEGEINQMLPQEMNVGQDVVITDPQIVINTSGIQVFGQASNGVVSARFRADLDLDVDENGRPRARVTGADFGPLPVPDSMLDDLSAALSDALLSAGGEALNKIRLTDITLLDGAVRITGVLR